MSSTKTLILTATYPADFSPPNSSRHHRLHRRIISALHIGGLLASLIATALFSAAIPKWNANFFHNTGPSSGDWTDGMPLGPLTFSFLYHAIVLIHARIRSVRHSSMQSPMPSPSPRWIFVHITVLVLVLLSLLPALFLAGYGALFRVWRPAIRTQSGILVCNMMNVFSHECEPVLYYIGNLQIGGIVFGALVGAVHFILLLDALRGLRRHMLVKQLQREKLAHYGAHEGRARRKGSRGSRRDLRTRHESSPRAGEVAGQHEHDHRHQHQPQRPQDYPTQMAVASPDSLGGSGTGPPPQQLQDRPPYFIRPPEQSRAGVSRWQG
ncbi:hypothetical protein A1O3_01553 [Capronia epimyces CBS 606.96]|uniref:Uncharacterized protein n=1 Tax=Capronia epimyces CBS 606.96 TaxID=1182542 RepID=W9YJC4_9EURO|nr:uncharacterized protein A1O3_01553 [Capronia epimyces CBS 606.96]EXJ92997.1 hypothetical protein A1O3_01553 [Capronia epimyces CBS 606.96]